MDYVKQITILYVEDDDDIREGYEKVLKRQAKDVSRSVKEGACFTIDL